MSIPIMTKDIALQIEKAKADYIDSWLQAMKGRVETSFKIDTLRIGNVRALVARDLLEIGLFNLVIGLGSYEKNALGEVVRFYQSHNVEKYVVEINPYNVSSDFLAYFTTQGFALSRFETYVCGGADITSSSASTSISIREVTSSEVNLFASLHIQGYQEALAHVSERTLKLYCESLKVLYGHRGWHLYIAWVNNIPSGMGMLYMQDGMASLAGGATLPNNRQQGVQTALLRHRIHVATQAQCTLVVGQASVGSTSQHNMERLGLYTAYTGTAWTR